MKVFKAPELIEVNNNKSIFLAGTIDMGDSEDWQSNFIKALSSSSSYKDVNIYNPRRDSWDNSWKQEFTNSNFYQQVSWELDALDKADIIVMNFLKDSKSPISLLELGLYAFSGKLLVCCPDEFYRAGNIQIVCNKYRIPIYKNMDLLINYLINNG